MKRHQSYILTKQIILKESKVFKEKHLMVIKDPEGSRSKDPSDIVT